MRRRALLAPCLLVLGVALPPPVGAAGGGRLTGTITDAGSGAPLAGANVVAQGLELGAVTDARGRYEVRGLPAGPVTLQLSLIGYATVEREVLVDAGGEARLDMQLATRPIALGETLVRAGRVTNLVGTATSANEGVLGAADLALRPTFRPAEIVESIPGVIVSQHSGSGKANQYYLRGFNLDHGTDLAVSADGVPVNMRTHAHGQGYADLNFLIPELVQGVDFEKGPYCADVGDFGAAGAFRIRSFDRLPAGLVRVDAGQVGYGRILVADNAALGGGNLVYAGHLEANDGPWDLSEEARKLGAVLRFSRGDEESGLTLAATAYHNDWQSTDQIPQRAIASGGIDRWGFIDSTDGGQSGRYCLSAEWRARSESTATQAMAYGMRYDLDLFSNFAYYLDDPVRGDQFEQSDERWVLGGQGRRTWTGSLGGRPTRTTAGVELRYDAIDNGLYHTQSQARLEALTVNEVGELSAGSYVESQVRWTPWLRGLAGLRGDLYRFHVVDLVGGRSDTRTAGTLGPKLNLVFGPWRQTELYLGGGLGFHSNDARGVTAAVDRATPLPRSKGAEVGARSAWIPGLQSSASLWLLDLESELVWVGDAGGNEPSGSTRRWGVELSNFYTGIPWLTVDADYAWSRGRYTDEPADADRIPQALVGTFDGGLAVHDLAGGLRPAHAGLRLRWFGPRPLIEDDSVRSQGTTLVYADVGWDLGARWTVALDVFNLLDAEASDIDYYYTSRLPGEPAEGIDDIHTHPAEPREVRVSIRARL